MQELIKVKNSSYTRYEELLLRRDNLQKEAFQYNLAYIREFGGLILQVFRKKIDCIRLKKTIEYCQAAVNHGRSVDQRQLQEYLRKELADFQRQLDEMIEDTENAANGRVISEVDLLTIKRIYRKLAKQIHPDINPLTGKTPRLLELWQRVQLAYNCNNKKDMEELVVLVNKALDQLGTGSLTIDIPDIEEKIRELEDTIAEIRETDPYAYRYLLEDAQVVAEKKANLAGELQAFEEYYGQLEKILSEYMAKGGSYTWQMN